MISLAIQGALVLLILMLLPVVWRIVQGPSHVERLQALDAFGTLLVGILVLLALLQNTVFMVDVALSLAAFSFIATFGIARYMAEGRMF